MLEVSAHVPLVLSHLTVVEACTTPKPGRGPGVTFGGANAPSLLGIMKEFSLLELLSKGQVLSLMHGRWYP